jgi:hypothetical protein
MDFEAPETAKVDAHARRTRALILVVTAVLIVAPVVVWLLTSGGAAKSP